MAERCRAVTLDQKGQARTPCGIEPESVSLETCGPCDHLAGAKIDPKTARVSIVLFTKDGPEAGMQDLARAPSILLNALDCSQNFEITEGVRRGHYRADRPGG